MIATTGLPPAPPPPPAQWRELTVVFRRKCGDVKAVDGVALGTLAVHPAWDADDCAVITHLPSKLAVARMSSIPDAVQATEWLWAQCRVAWLEEDVDKSKLTAEVLQWIGS